MILFCLSNFRTVSRSVFGFWGPDAFRNHEPVTEQTAPALPCRAELRDWRDPPRASSTVECRGDPHEVQLAGLCDDRMSRCPLSGRQGRTGSQSGPGSHSLSRCLRGRHTNADIRLQRHTEYLHPVQFPAVFRVLRCPGTSLVQRASQRAGDMARVRAFF